MKIQVHFDGGQSVLDRYITYGETCHVMQFLVRAKESTDCLEDVTG